MEEEDTKTGFNSLNVGSRRKGGFRASTFIFAFTALENMGFVANIVSLFVYLRQVMYFDASSSANTVTNFMGSAFLLSIIGGFMSDAYLSRLNTCLVFGAIEILALVLVTVQSYSHDLHPNPCGKSSCLKGGMAFMFYVSFCMLALGSGGVKGSLPALGGDQFDQKDPDEEKSLARYFNWLLLSSTLGAAVGVIGIVTISTDVNWYWGFMIITVATFVGLVILACGKPFFRLRAPGESPITQVAQVIVLAFKNRKLALPENPDDLYEINDKGITHTQQKIAHTNEFRVTPLIFKGAIMLAFDQSSTYRARFLDKAAIVGEFSKPAPWTVCTVTQVEEVKILVRMLPIIGSTIIMNTCLAQLQTFSILQGTMMDGHLGSIKIPAPSIPVIPLVFMSILIPIYELLFVPLIRKITHHPSGITQLQRVGVGLVLSVISMTVAGFVEVKRKNQAKPISLFWLSFQYSIFGIADMFTLVGLLEFFYKEAPVGMRSLSTSFTWLSLSLGYFLSSVLVDIINAVTKRKGKPGWLGGLQPNEFQMDRFYWFLAVLSSLNFFNYLFWAYRYKYKSEVPDSKPEPGDLHETRLANDESTTNEEGKNDETSSSNKTEDAKEKEQVAEDHQLINKQRQILAGKFLPEKGA